MVPEENGALQERQRAELPHQVRGSAAWPQGREGKGLRAACGGTESNPVLQLEGRSGLQRLDPQTQTGADRVRQAQEGKGDGGQHEAPCSAVLF